MMSTSISLYRMMAYPKQSRSEEHTSELQSHLNLVCRLLLEKKKRNRLRATTLQDRPHRFPRKSPRAPAQFEMHARSTQRALYRLLAIIGPVPDYTAGRAASL